MASQRIPCPNARVSEYVTLSSKRDFIKIKIFIRKHYPGLSRLDLYNHKGDYQGKRKARE